MTAQIAQIENLGLTQYAAQLLARRVESLPGIAVLYGPAGYGKSIAAETVAKAARGFYVQVRSAWTRKTLLKKILAAMDEKKETKGTLDELLDACCTKLAEKKRLLALDEFDYCCRNDNMIELIRDLYEGSQASFLLVGEERIEARLKRWERFHSRILTWIPAQPASREDAGKLAAIYCPAAKVKDDLLRHLVDLSRGSVRRLCVNLSAINEEALAQGWREVSSALWGDRPLSTGDAPKRREALPR
jgi:hypothetical protein